MFQGFAQHALCQAQITRSCIQEILWQIWYLSIQMRCHWRILNGKMTWFDFILKGFFWLLCGEWTVGTGMEARRAMSRPLQRQMRYHGGLGQNTNSTGFKKSSASRLFGMSDFLTDDMWRVRKRKQRNWFQVAGRMELSCMRHGRYSCGGGGTLRWRPIHVQVKMSRRTAWVWRDWSWRYVLYGGVVRAQLVHKAQRLDETLG